MIKKHPLLDVGFAAIFSLPLVASAQFYGDPPDDTHPWSVHDLNRPQPPRVEPGATPGAPPSDAIVLLGDSAESFANWVHEKDDRKNDWVFKDGVMRCAPGAGYIRTKEEFGDCQLHVEWSAPTPVEGDSQGRGNSGVFLMGMTEVQVLDNYDNPTYPDGFAGSVYGVMPPMANSLRKPGEWQVYDIVFRRPIIKDGVVIDPGSQTVFINGVVVQNGTVLEGGGGHKKRSNPLRAYPEKGPLKIQDHGNPVRFRNIWYRNLRKRASDGGTDGQLSKEATTAKRNEIAASLRKDAATKSGKEKLLRLMESLCYQDDEGTVKEVESMVAGLISRVDALEGAKLDSAKGGVMEVSRALAYLTLHQRLPGNNPMAEPLDALVKAKGWEEKK